MNSDELKENISMRELVERYGIKVNRNGFCCCPFHQEKTASMKVYEDSYFCFGCGAHGDIFTFVQSMDHVDFKTAFKKLGGHYQEQSEYKRSLAKYHWEMQKETQKAKANRKAEEKRQILEEIRQEKFYAKMFPVYHEEWCKAMNRLEYLYYRLDCLTEGK